jgi:hypothetical protein
MDGREIALKNTPKKTCEFQYMGFYIKGLNQKPGFWIVRFLNFFFALSSA